MPNKIRFFLLIILMFSITSLILLWTLMNVLKNGLDLSSIVMMIASILFIIFAVYVLRKVYTSLRRGDPLKDERTRKIEKKAAALSFYVGIYWLLVLSFVIDRFELKIPSSSVPSLGIAGMAVFFGLSYWYFSKKGE